MALATSFNFPDLATLKRLVDTRDLARALLQQEPKVSKSKYDRYLAPRGEPTASFTVYADGFKDFGGSESDRRLLAWCIFADKLELVLDLLVSLAVTPSYKSETPAQNPLRRMLAFLPNKAAGLGRMAVHKELDRVVWALAIQSLNIVPSPQPYDKHQQDSPSHSQAHAALSHKEQWAEWH